jgi:hypothetical protein
MGDLVIVPTSDDSWNNVRVRDGDIDPKTMGDIVAKNLTMTATYVGPKYRDRDDYVILALPDEHEGRRVRGWTISDVSFEIIGGFTEKSFFEKFTRSTLLWGIPVKNIIDVALPKKVVSPGYHCSNPKCNEFNEYAELNMGDRYTCYQCRQDPYRFSF